MTTAVLVESHDFRLVILSILISILAAYAARSLVERLRDADGRIWFVWLLGGATADGIGIWSMHYTAMLGFSLPIPIVYNWPMVLLSLLVGILGSAGALFIVGRGNIGRSQVLGAGLFLGAVGISGLHYTAMAAMRQQAMHHYSPALVILSILVAIFFCFMTLSLTFVYRNRKPSARRLRTHGGAILRGSANPAMHFTAMAAINFTPSLAGMDLSRTVSISSIGVIGISIVPVGVIIVVLLTTLADRVQKQRALLDQLFEQAPEAVALINANDQVVRINKEFTRLFGYAPQETVGRRLSELTVPDESRDEYERYAKMSARGQRVDAEAVRKRKDGSWLHASVTRVPVSVPGGDVEVYAMYRDISERKQAEDALRSSQAQLRALAAYLQNVREEERAHISRELHDEIGQGLTAIKLALERSAAAELQQALTEANDLIGKVRDISLELRPAMLDDLGLLAALKWHVERYTSQFKIAVDFKQSGLEGRRFAPEVEIAAYRIVQEALTNVARHAKIDKVEVQIDAGESALRIRVKDLGVGFDIHFVSATKTGGLSGIRERAMILGGRLGLDSAPGSGTLLTVELPL